MLAPYPGQNAWLYVMFLDNDDMHLPFRFFQYASLLKGITRPILKTLFYCCGKLLIDVTKANAKFETDDEDTYDQLVFTHFHTFHSDFFMYQINLIKIR